MVKNKTILITGGTGFIGKNLIDSLKNEYNLILLGRTEKTNYKNLSFYKCDISEISDLENIFKKEKTDIIIHLATYYKPKNNLDDISGMIDTNVKGLTNLLELSIKYNINKLINTGTCFEFGNQDKKVKEESVYEPWNLYAETKILAENLIDYYSKKGINVLTLKLFPPFGIHDNHKKLIPYVIKSALSNKNIETSPGEQKWDYIYSKDIANAYKKAIDFDWKGHEKFIISNNRPIKLKEIINKILKLTNSKSEVFFGAKNYRQNEIMYLHGDNSKAKELLDWEPQYNIDDALKETIDYFKGYDDYGNN